MLTLLLETIRDWVKSVLASFHSMYLGYVTPQMFGAVGDGEHDDTEAIQQALNRGGTIYFPKGTYLISLAHAVAGSAILDITKQNTRVTGEYGQSIIAYDDVNNTRNVALVRVNASNISVSGIAIRGSETYGNTLDGQILLGVSPNCENIVVDNCIFQNNKYVAVKLSSSIDSVLFHHCRFEATDCGIISQGHEGAAKHVTIQDCFFSGKSTYNDFTNYASEPISIMNVSQSECASNWIIENCTFEYKKTTPLNLGPESRVEDTVYVKDIVVRDCTFRATKGGVTLCNAENVVVDNLFFDGTPSPWAEENYSGHNYFIRIMEHNRECIVRNIVAEISAATPISIGQTSYNCIIDNVVMKVSYPVPTRGSIEISGINNTVKNVTIKPNVYGLTKERVAILKEALNCYVDVHGVKNLGTSVGIRTYAYTNSEAERVAQLPTADASLAGTTYMLTGEQSGYTKGGIYKCQENFSSEYEWISVPYGHNTIMFDNANGSTFNEKDRANDKDIESPNTWIPTGVQTGTKDSLEEVITSTLPTTYLVKFNSAQKIEDSKTIYDKWKLMNEGFEYDLEFQKNAPYTTNKTFNFPSTGNIIPFNWEFDFSDDYNVICHFKQINGKWVEMQRLKRYTDGRIEDISRPELVTRSEMEQYIQETDTIPTASANYVGKSYLYTGATTATYQKGGIYECQEVTPSTNPATYHWVQIGVSTTQLTELLSAITSATDFADLQSRLQGNAQS